MMIRNDAIREINENGKNKKEVRNEIRKRTHIDVGFEAGISTHSSPAITKERKKKGQSDIKRVSESRASAR